MHVKIRSRLRVQQERTNPPLMTHIKLLWRFRCTVAAAGTVTLIRRSLLGAFAFAFGPLVLTFCKFVLTFCPFALTFCLFALTFCPFALTMDFAPTREPCDCVLGAELLGPFLPRALPFATTTLALPCNGCVARPLAFGVAAPSNEEDLAPREAAPSFIAELGLVDVC